MFMWLAYHTSLPWMAADNRECDRPCGLRSLSACTETWRDIHAIGSHSRFSSYFAASGRFLAKSWQSDIVCALFRTQLFRKPVVVSWRVASLSEDSSHNHGLARRRMDTLA